MKFDIIFKSLFLLVAIIATYAIFSISVSMNNFGRFAPWGDGRILDTKTGKFYYTDNEGNLIKIKNGKWIKLKELPK
jgi:hypothetical protein